MGVPQISHPQSTRPLSRIVTPRPLGLEDWKRSRGKVLIIAESSSKTLRSHPPRSPPPGRPGIPPLSPCRPGPRISPASSSRTSWSPTVPSRPGSPDPSPPGVLEPPWMWGPPGRPRIPPSPRLPEPHRSFSGSAAVAKPHKT